MKRAIYILMSVLLSASWSCSELDNFEEPKETLYGKIIDKGTGETLQCEAGDSSVRLKLMEYSWSDEPTPLYCVVRQDGTFNNSRIFKGEYGIVPEGPFVPLQRYDDNGILIKDESKMVKIKGEAYVDFEVEPFLRVDWMGEPVINADGTISVDVRVVRGTTDYEYQAPVSSIALFLSSTAYVGDNNYSDKYSQRMSFEGEAAEPLLGTVITMTTREPVPTARPWFLRAGARIDYTIAGRTRYNYTTGVRVDVP